MTRIQRLAAGAAGVCLAAAVTPSFAQDPAGFQPIQFQMAPGAAQQNAQQAGPETALQTLVASGRALGEPLFAKGDVQRFYARRAGAPAWVGNGRLSGEARDLIDALQRAGEHGLDPSAYHLAALSTAIDDRGRIAQGAEEAADALLTDAFMRFATHLLNGTVDPTSLADDVEAAPEARDLAMDLDATLRGGSIGRTLAGLAPQHPQYRMLQEAYQHYARAASENPWPKIDSGDLLRPGDRDPRVEQIRARLYAEDAFDARNGGTGLFGRAPQTPDMQAAAAYGTGGTMDPMVYDAALQSRVEDFQRAHGLDADGVVGPGTLAMLNQGLNERADAIRMNLERWRWLPNDLGQRYILVNAPQYTLHAYDNGRETLTMDVIVGRDSRQTPQFSDTMEYLVVNPDWNVPYNIAVADKLPKLRSDPGYFDRMGYDIYNSSGQRVSPHNVNWSNYSRGHFPFTIRQRPGAMNALGTIKFIFPNQYNVYLHDTDSPELFTEDQRSISSGCVRLSDPRALARWVTDGDPTLDYRVLEAAWDSGETETLYLGQQIPVHLAYFTTWVGDGGAVDFYADTYGRDARLHANLFGAS